MKPLPSHLEYSFLCDDSTYPIIFSSELNKNDLDRLVNLVKKHRKVIGYTIDDIKGINPFIVTHRINVEPDATPSIKAQRRLNHNMKEVVKKEVLKFLNAGIIYLSLIVSGYPQYRLSLKRKL